jgi:hypothetical protein
MTLPPITAPKDKPTLAIMLTATRLKRLMSNKLLVSSANDDMVVNEPQKPTATNSVYLVSRLNASAKIEN